MKRDSKSRNPPEKLKVNTVKNNYNIKALEWLSSGAQAEDLVGTESAEKQSNGFTSAHRSIRR